MHGYQCAVCDEQASIRFGMHHTILQQVLRRELPADVFEVAVMDPRNSLPLCRGCHADHHGIHPIHRGVLTDCHHEFAAEHGLTWRLELDYPEIELPSDHAWGLTREQIVEVRGSSRTVVELAERFGVTVKTVRKARDFKTWDQQGRQQ